MGEPLAIKSWPQTLIGGLLLGLGGYWGWAIAGAIHRALGWP